VFLENTEVLVMYLYIESQGGIDQSEVTLSFNLKKQRLRRIMPWSSGQARELRSRDPFKLNMIFYYHAVCGVYELYVLELICRRSCTGLIRKAVLQNVD